jgi:uncharacterized membrane protein
MRNAMGLLFPKPHREDTMRRFIPIFLPVFFLFWASCQDQVLEPDISLQTTAAAKKPPRPPVPDPGGNSLLPEDLGTLGGPSSIASDISPDGWIVGRSLVDADGPRRPFLWRELGGMEELPLPGRFEPMTDHDGVTYPLVINGDMMTAMIAGAAPDPERPHPEHEGLFKNTVIVWTTSDGGNSWVAEDLPLPNFHGGVDPENTFATGINDEGILIARYWEPFHGSMVWDVETGRTADDWIRLRDPAGAMWTEANDINNAGVIAGYSRMEVDRDYSYKALYWLPPYDDDPMELPQYQGWPVHQAHGIKENGDIVGWAQRRNKKVGLIWRNAGSASAPSYGAPELFEGPEMNLFITLAINACDQIAGGEKVLDTDGTLLTLESASFGVLSSPAINDMGWISGTSSDGSGNKATLWKLPAGC